MYGYDGGDYSTEYFVSTQWVQTDESERKHRQLQLPIDTGPFARDGAVMVRAAENDRREWPRSDEQNRGNRACATTGSLVGP